MSERDILIRALRASGSEREAQLAEAILPAAPAAAAAEASATPAAAAVADAAPAVPAEVAAPAAQRAAGPTPPPGRPPLTIADLSTISPAEALARMGEVEALEREEQQQRRAG
jgi:hypothetical protein